ncbi:hypothetical protein QFZ75_008026 [Streptomyces sp. V3I8]|uniref:hypothetical protein n=1 Tax=Streptomyces sp. V3I8 TaxID=3042279 RepID=UPI0027802C0E|nr:hypothetical protein [Streptomyces sp. V3I8]MDQ1041524.1 hypothetical protein [Streptomyces sp. V3I8]
MTDTVTTVPATPAEALAEVLTMYADAPDDRIMIESTIGIHGPGVRTGLTMGDLRALAAQHTPATFAPTLRTEGAFHLVARVTVHADGEMSTDLDESKVSSSITGAVDRMPSGLRGAEVFAVWDFEQRPNPAEAADAARQERPARILVHVGNGILKQLTDTYRLDLEVTES